MRRFTRPLRLGVISILGLGMAIAGRAKAHDEHRERCRKVSGAFEDQFMAGSSCPSSPIMLCTTGSLQDDLAGTYSFQFDTETTVGARNDPDAPSTFSFTGASHVTTSDGQLFSHDEGAIEENENGLSPFFNHIHFDRGTGRFDGAHGELTAIGQVSLETGAGQGTYFGELCDRDPDT